MKAKAQENARLAEAAAAAAKEKMGALERERAEKARFFMIFLYVRFVIFHESSIKFVDFH